MPTQWSPAIAVDIVISTEITIFMNICLVCFYSINNSMSVSDEIILQLVCLPISSTYPKLEGYEFYIALRIFILMFVMLFLV